MSARTTGRRARTRAVSIGAAVAAAALTLPLAAAPASANSFSGRIYQGSYSYDDGADRFCVHADEVNIRDRAVVSVTLTPFDSSRGPVVRLADVDTPGRDCASLARAYEDTHYRAVIKSLLSFDRLGGSTYKTKTVDFYS